MLIGIVGRKRNGKDTLARAISAAGLQQGKAVAVLRFADPIKDTACRWFGFTLEQVSGEDPDTDREDPAHGAGGLSIREILQRIGMAARLIDQDVYTRLLIREYQAKRSTTGDLLVVVPDVRFPNEVDAIREAGGLVVGVVREGAESDDDHPSETQVDRALELCDLVFHNHTIEDKADRRAIVSDRAERQASRALMLARRNTWATWVKRNEP